MCGPRHDEPSDRRTDERVTRGLRDLVDGTRPVTPDEARERSRRKKWGEWR